MDLQLVKTFLVVAESGSFAAASERLFVTQSAVSLRVQRLEDQLGATLFISGKDGVTLSKEGMGFRPHALLMIKHWQAAQEAMSADRAKSAFSLSAPESLWTGLIETWALTLQTEQPEISLALSLQAENESADLHLSYSQKERSGYAATGLFEDVFVLVGEGERYIHIDLSPEFDQWQKNSLPDLQKCAVRMDSVSAALAMLRQGGWTAYLPLRHILPDLAAKTLRLRKNFPRFPAQIWAHWRDGIGDDLRDVAQKTLNESAFKLSYAQLRALG